MFVFIDSMKITSCNVKNVVSPVVNARNCSNSAILSITNNNINSTFTPSFCAAKPLSSIERNRKKNCLMLLL